MDLQWLDIYTFETAFLEIKCFESCNHMPGRFGGPTQRREATLRVASWGIQWCCGDLRCWDLCTSSRLEVAADGQMAPVMVINVCLSGAVRISTDGCLHAKHVKQRFVTLGTSSIISIHVY